MPTNKTTETQDEPRELAIKSGVSIRGIKPEMVLAAVIVHSVYQTEGYLCTITSCTDSRHGIASLHYVGYAIDIRTRNLKDKATLLRIISALRLNLGVEFDVLHETNHIHIEYQPKQPMETK